MKRVRSTAWTAGRTHSILVLVAVLVGADRGWAQIPGLPSVSKPAASSTAGAGTNKGEGPTVAPTLDNPEATVATASGPISVEKPVDDVVQAMLADLLPKYQGVRSVQVAVENGVVTLDGQVEDADVRENVTLFTRRVEGVRLVLNRMKTDAQVLTASELAGKVLWGLWRTVARSWLLVVIALAIGLSGLLLARLFNTYSEVLLAPFIKNVLVRSVVGSLLSSILIVGGILLGLNVLDLTQAVLSILGLAGVVGLAVGFAFRDIAENFIASILLGVRRPFRIGDYVEVAGKAGVVLSLNTRATVLVTLEGNHIRIPNNIIYKEILVNSSASPSSRGSFDVMIPYAVSTAQALDAVTRALDEQEGILADPPPRALLEALERDGVRLRAYYWIPVRGIDGNKLQSDVKLKVKVALQQAGITPPPTGVMISVAGRVPVDVSETGGRARSEVVAPSPLVTADQAKANLRHDTRAAEKAEIAPNGEQQTPMEHALCQSEHVSDEGTNLLQGRNEEPVRN